jgi:hypothetical protein
MKNRLSVSLCATLAATIWSALADPSIAAGPPRAWAHAGHVVDLKPNGTPIANKDPLDRALVQESFARWGIAYDEGRLDVISSLFTTDAKFEVLNGSPTPIVATQGHDAVVAGIKSAIAQQGDQRRHLISNVVIDRLTATEATAIAYAVVVVPDKPMYVGTTVIYSANLRKSGGVWRFSRLVIGMDGYEGTPPSVGQEAGSHH